MRQADPLREGERIFTICNACRYCEGFCAVFPAMERRMTFAKADLEYLANLCHNCGECLDACQYAPPHEFAVNVPIVLAEIRERSYVEHAWPGRPRLTIVAVMAIATMAAIWASPAPSLAGLEGFYGAFPYEAMVTAFGILGGFAAVALAVVAWKCGAGPRPTRDPRSRILMTAQQSGRGPGAARGAAPLASELASGAVRDVLTLTYLGGARRWFHHTTFYGFLLCFASTTSAAFYHHVLDLQAPYDYFSVPVVLGTLGGLGLLIGPAGLFFLKPRDLKFLTMLFATSLTGFALMLLRETQAMVPLLYVHLGVVALLFVTMPYGKFVHGIYRSAALVRYAVERHAGK